MQFQRLKLSGFKSFVDATEFRIEPGLTGIVGPNGCGKSNLLEALRWVMGATSARAMRGAGMEDVIFAGSDKRPPRSHAEVTLSIDNSARKAPQPFTDQPVLDISRRIDRGQGSTYRVNGKEVRARDVQLLFADASTGANSPALVRQGQISELIAARPQNRRRVLEEAGGVSGLHTRRHEAELRLRAAETNLSRLDDISRELDTMLSRLKREARQADKYKKISSEIRALQKAIWHARWLEALSAFQAAQADMQAQSRQVENTARAAATAQLAALKAAEAIAPLREEEAIAATIDHRLSLEKERLDVESAQALAEIDRLKSDLIRLEADQARERELAEDGEAQIAQLTERLERVRLEIKEAPSREPELKAAVLLAEGERVEADQRIEALAAELAGLTERQRLETAHLKEAQTRFERLLAQSNQAEREKQALGAFDSAQIEALQDAVSASHGALEAARSEAEALENLRPAHAEAEAQTRKTVRDIEDRLGRLTAEARGLAQILSPGPKTARPVLDLVQPEKGYEKALAAALGDDLNLGLSRREAASVPAFWAEDFTSEAPLPDLTKLGVRLLAEAVRAPPALSLRLKSVGIVDPADGDALQARLPVGARLVSTEGDLWRWDGLIVRAGAPAPAAVRLSQRARLEELENDIDALKPQLAPAQGELDAATEAVKQLEARLRQSRARLPETERDLRLKTAQLEETGRAQARHEMHLEGLGATLKRLHEELREARSAYEALADAQSAPENLSQLNAALVEARQQAQDKRQAVLAARSALDEDSRNRSAREGRERSLSRDLSEWTRRHGDSAGRTEKLKAEQTATQTALKQAEAAPEAFETRRLQLVDSLHQAQTRLAAAREALAAAETLKVEADQTEKAQAEAAAQAREHRAAAQARLEAATARKDEVQALILDQTGDTPEALGQRLKAEAIATPADISGAESLLSGLERERDQLGAVNLRAEEEAAEYQERLESLSRERADLTTAIARLRDGIDELNAEGRERLLAAFEVINAHFKTLFTSLFGGGEAELRLVESDDPLEAGLEIYACPPGKRLSVMSLMSGGEQALTATALIFGVFLANPAPVCVLDEVDAPLDDANVDRYCRLLDEMRTRTDTRFITITHNPVTMARMDRLFGVTMAERGVSQLVSVDLRQAEALISE